MADTVSGMSDEVVRLHEANRQERARRRRLLEAHSAAPFQPLRHWLKWAIEPMNAIAHGVRLARLKHKRQGVIAEFLARDEFKGIQLGCGKFPIEGWLNSDFVYPRGFWKPLTEIERNIDIHIDMTEPLPFPDATLDAVFAEEVIEHVSREAGVFFLEQAARCLKPGGVCRLTTPDAEGICRVFSGGVEGVSPENWEPFWLNPYWSDDRWLNGNFRYYGHQQLWHWPSLRDAALDAGFSRAERVWVHETVSGLVEMEHLERHGMGDPVATELSRHVRLVVEFFR